MARAPRAPPESIPAITATRGAQPTAATAPSASGTPNRHDPSSPGSARDTHAPYSWRSASRRQPRPEASRTGPASGSSERDPGSKTNCVAITAPAASSSRTRVSAVIGTSASRNRTRPA